MIFTNSQIDLSLLPRGEEVEFQLLSPAYRNVEYIGTAIFWGVVFLGWLIFFATGYAKLPILTWVMLGAWILMFALSMFFAGKRYEVAGYALREHDIVHKAGVYWRTVTTIPFNRMQHCEISRGPIESAFGLATLRVFTAGGASSDLSIEGLPNEEAQRIKEFITQKIGEQKEEL
ncbi:MAG: PH domain-containing protein [Lewinellaceae bacterium]|nr:PH domain-containing protein [Saprospiraceae bacterium]MCB9339398.1 PH domain-containing protein [Lewinellaceae bacterium]